VSCWANRPNQSSPIDCSVDPYCEGTFLQISTLIGTGCGVRTDLTFSCWGVAAPDCSVETFCSYSFTQVSEGGGSGNTCGILIDGTLDCIGQDEPCTFSADNPCDGTFTQVDTWHYTCAIRTSGSLTCAEYYGETSDSACVISCAPVLVPQAAQLRTNAIQDGGGELGSPWVPGWQTAGGLTLNSYGAGGDLSKSSPGPKNRGKYYFYGGANNAKSWATQEVDFSPLLKQVKKGKVKFILSGLLGGLAGQNDSATLTATFLDAKRKVLKTSTITSGGSAARKGKTELLFRTARGAVPRKARLVQLVLLMKRFDGADNDGLADNLSLVLNKT
jgi:hypothetical protein